jgi:hypothetical protein
VSRNKNELLLSKIKNIMWKQRRIQDRQREGGEIEREGEIIRRGTCLVLENRNWEGVWWHSVY